MDIDLSQPDPETRKYVRLLGGQNMPIVGLGLFLANDHDALEKAIEHSLEAGYTHFDTAFFYQNEHVLGRVLKRWLDSGKVKREDLFITTKLPWNGMSPEKVEHFANLSLKNLELDYVDLYLCHYPIGMKFVDEKEFVPRGEKGEILFDKKTDHVAIWKEMEKLVEAGKTKSIGLSNFNERQIERIVKHATIPPANLQIEVHVYFQNRSLRQFAEKHNISVTAYAPLGSPGRRTAVFKTVQFDIPNVLEDPTVVEIAKKHGKSPGQVLLKFLAQQDVIVIPKSTNAERIKQNIDLFDFKLTPVDMRKLEQLDKGEAGRSFPGFPGMNQHPECPW